MKLALKATAAIALPLLFAAGTALPSAAATTAAKAPTANQIAAKARADLKAAKSFHMWGTINVPGRGGGSDALNVTSGHDECAGTSTSSGTTIGWVQIGSTTWLQVAGTPWAQMTTAQAQGTLVFCTESDMSSLIGSGYSLKLGPVTQISHQRVQELKGTDVTIYVTLGAKPEYVRFQISGAGSETFNFSGINAPVKISPPSGSLAGQ
jgi:hypothetical protein